VIIFFFAGEEREHQVVYTSNSDWASLNIYRSLMHYDIIYIYYQQIGLKFEEETSEMLRLEHGSVWC